MAPQNTPFLADLRASVEALYRLAPAYVPKTLMVCRCPVCMSGETLAAMLTTPVRDLPAELIREYSSSAHGTPTDPDDLNALLPRYLDLIAQGVPVGWNSIGADLHRFGDARGMPGFGDARGMPGFPASGMAAEMDSYARALLLHFGMREVQAAKPVETPWALLSLLLIGGWSIDTVSVALDELFAWPDIGRAALVCFLSDMAQDLRDGRLQLWALSHYRAEAAPGLATWLGQLLDSNAVSDILTDPDLPEEQGVWIPSLAGLRGQIMAAMLGG